MTRSLTKMILAVLMISVSDSENRRGTSLKVVGNNWTLQYSVDEWRCVEVYMKKLNIQSHGPVGKDGDEGPSSISTSGWTTSP
jgi:hypothetical protein